MKSIIIIPARLESTRLPNKMLIDINNKPLIYRTYSQAMKVKNIDRVIIATDSKEIERVCKAFCKDIIRTSSNCKTGSDRVAEVSRNIDTDIIINIQGDEPIFNPNDIEKLIDVLKDDSIFMSTLIKQMKTSNIDSNIVKVVKDIYNNAILFSRAVIPYPCSLYKHIGIYAFTKNSLEKYTNLERTPLEYIESLEQLRIIENGYKIKLVETDCDSISINVMDDVDKLRKYYETI